MCIRDRAWVFYAQWKDEIRKRESAEKRERDLLRVIHNLPPENAETLVPPPGAGARIPAIAAELPSARG